MGMIQQKKNTEDANGILQWQRMPENRGNGGARAAWKELAVGGSRESSSTDTREKLERSKDVGRFGDGKREQSSSEHFCHQRKMRMR